MECGRSENGSAVQLAEIGEILALYYKMFTGRSCRFASDRDRIGLFWEDIASLPEEWRGFDDASVNRAWYLMAVTHRAAHLEFHTFDLPIPHQLEERFKALAPASASGDLVLKNSRNVLELLANRDLRRNGLYSVVRILEDYRVDQRLKKSYPGLAVSMNAIQKAELAAFGSSGGGMPPRSRFAQMIAEMSLDRLDRELELPEILYRPSAALATAKARLSESGASVFESIVFGIRLWTELLGLPNMVGVYEIASKIDMSLLDMADEQTGGAGLYLKLEDVPHLEGSEVLAIEIPEAAYRDDLSVDSSTGAFGLPLADALMVFEALSGTGSPFSLDEEDLRSAAEEERKFDWEAPPEPLPHEHVHDEGEPFHFEHGSLKRRDAADFLYPEWDVYQKSYRSDWVRVHELLAAGALKPSDASRAEASVRSYGTISRRFRSQLESIIPAGLSRVGGFYWGDEIDLDAGIQMMVDRRSGVRADDRVYQVQVHDKRDVVISLLLDISCSTAERQDSAGQFVEDPQLGWVPRELTWSELRSPAIFEKGYRTLLDIEVEIAAVISSVMNLVGDGFGLYAFSGSGRSEVVFQILKEMDERFGTSLYRRLDNLRPVHSTRMGAAIRHAAKKLARLDAKTRLLILLSDGRPFDVDYGPPDEHGHSDFDPDYARGDTLRAVEECQRLKVKFGAILTGSPDDATSLASGGPLWTQCEDVDDLTRGVASLFGRLLDSKEAVAF
ncbi:MAG: hypothetical protein M0Z39_00060 [Actinomycetota bacterium]|nr:hypothetical protein [Actinomycetota bacterium]